MSIALSLRHVSKTYSTGGRTFKALDNVDLDIEEGKLVVILGPSGAGKSTLLNLIGGMDSPSEGTIMAGVTILKLLKEQTEHGKTVIIVTHNSLFADVADVVVRLKNGRIRSVSVVEDPKSIDDVEW